MGHRSSCTASTEVGARELARETRPSRIRWRARQVEARGMRLVSVHHGGGDPHSCRDATRWRLAERLGLRGIRVRRGY
jgi:hypothetical protein